MIYCHLIPVSVQVSACTVLYINCMWVKLGCDAELEVQWTSGHRCEGKVGETGASVNGR